MKNRVNSEGKNRIIWPHIRDCSALRSNVVGKISEKIESFGQSLGLYSHGVTHLKFDRLPLPESLFMAK